MYDELQRAFDHFNTELFGGQLPACMITLQRQKMTEGYFSPKRFAGLDGSFVDEIALNPSFFAVRGIRGTMQTLAHEQTHAWQLHYGQSGRGRYHNAQWADKMVEIGLMPSDTGRPGGKKTGDRMSDYVIDGGRFDIACAKLLTKQFALSFLDRFPVSIVQLAETMHQLPEEVQLAISEEEIETLSIQLIDQQEPKKKTTICYKCPLCTIKVWGKPNLAIACVACKTELQPEGVK
jgi:hypothetical protein